MGNFSYSNELVAVVKGVLDGSEWNYSFNEERGVFDFGLKTSAKIQKINYFVVVRDDEIIFYGICPINADENDAGMMARMAEFLSRVNYGIKNGCFEFDFRDGEIRYKSFVDCDEVIPSTEVVGNSICCINAMYNRFSQGIIDIIFRDSSVNDAIEKCERLHEEGRRRFLISIAKNDEDTDVEED